MLITAHAIYLRNRPPTLSHTQRPHSPTVPVPFTARGLAAAGPGLLASIGLLADTVHDFPRRAATVNFDSPLGLRLVAKKPNPKTTY